jgi:1-aminocyclopropane-1-carboxylate deaminase
VICCAVGTGGTISGIINASEEHQQILGFPALKGDFLKPEIERFSKKNNWELITNYHFGGYAKVDRELIDFMNNFRSNYGVLLDPVYTGKMMYGIFDLLDKGYFLKNTRILAIHTGGLQGISGMNELLKMKNLPPILM